MTEARLIRRVPKSGYATRRSASESATRSPMYFPEVDVDVRPRPRSDEPDFSHIKSTEDISSGYSSADNSASLTRTASLGARARSRAGRTQITTIKRPQAAEESEVNIEELRDDELEYANMPSLVNLPAQIFMSHTDPPFLYQYVGDQVRIIQVLGDDPLVAKSNINTYKNMAKDDVISDKSINDIREKVDQNERATNETSENTIEQTKDPFQNKEIIESENKLDVNVSNEMSVLEPEGVKENDNCDNLAKPETLKDNKPEIKKNEDFVENAVAIDTNKESSGILKETNKESKIDQETLYDVKETEQETVSSNASLNEMNSAESGDDEASFGTPDNSPKTKRKLAKGKYGKGKAPPPPVVDNIPPPVIEDTNKINLKVCDTTSQETLVDIVNRMPNTAIKESGTFNKDLRNLQVVNPIAENKRRHKSKSPGKIPKGNTSTIGRLLQLPGKLAFWNKTDEMNKSKSDLSEMSDHSRRSSNVDQAVIDEFQSCADLTKIIPLGDTNVSEKADDQISFKDAFESEDISQEIIDKSDALLKLIEAKIESHPEYKIVALHAEEVLTTSKSTDV